VLALKEFVSSETIVNYNSLRSTKSWIYCEKQLADLDDFLLRNWQERLFFERLERNQNLFLNCFIKQIRIGNRFCFI
jgi:hypothetical protein